MGVMGVMGAALDFPRRPVYPATRVATPSFEDAEFLFGHCPACGTEVLTYADFDAEDNELRRCLACEALVQTSIRRVRRENLEDLGYAVIEARTCGNGGGCGSGGCGMQSPPHQPTAPRQ